MSTKLSRYEKLLQQPQVRSLLDTIRYAEGTPGEAGYRTQFTGVQFDPNKKGWVHPRQVKGSSSGYRSDAAGAYQFLSPTWDGVQKELGLSDFSPRNQDIAALRLIERRGALDPFLKGAKFGEIMNRLSPEWASLPTNQGKSYYGQPVKKLGDLYNYYEQRKQTSVLPVAASPAVTGQPISTSLSVSEILAPILGGAANQNTKRQNAEASDFLNVFKKHIIEQAINPFGSFNTWI
jgi:muramidase (phage lysozyme)